MFDIHCHILPGLDDGARTIEESMAMAEDAIADGITHVVGTPHSSTDHEFRFKEVQAARRELEGLLDGRLTIATGCDFHLSPDNLEKLRVEAAPFCINQKDYLLVEFNEFSIPPWMDQALHEIQLAGMHPIITHPERNGLLRAQPERLMKWCRVGCYVQVTAGSLEGVFGPKAREDAWRWIREGVVHFVSSDAHNTGRRPLKLKFAFEQIAAEVGEEVARALLIDNPKSAFEGQPLPYVPEIQEPEERRKRKRFLFF
jgi:protein-tyrosine phosphatase